MKRKRLGSQCITVETIASQRLARLRPPLKYLNEPPFNARGCDGAWRAREIVSADSSGRPLRETPFRKSLNYESLDCADGVIYNYKRNALAKLG